MGRRGEERACALYRPAGHCLYVSLLTAAAPAGGPSHGAKNGEQSASEEPGWSAFACQSAECHFLSCANVFFLGPSVEHPPRSQKV